MAEPLDASGHIFGAFCDEGLVGSVRVNYGDEGDFGDYFELYGMDRFGAYAPAELCIVTKLMLLPAFRAGTLMARLRMAMYEHTRDHKPHMKFCLIDCIPPYQGYFERIGYRPIGPRIRHPAAGLVIPLAFPVYDLEHFGRIRSPLARVCPRHDRVSVGWFSKTFGPARDHGRSRILRHWRARQASGSQEIGALNQR